MSLEFENSPFISLEKLETTTILNEAHLYAKAYALKFTGAITPQNAWALIERKNAVLVDVRTHEERKFVGYVSDSIHIAWANGTALNRNPRFIKELEKQVGKDQTILLLCRSGKRSALAAELAHSSGFENIYSILEGFEGDLDSNLHRNTFNGWRYHQLPWLQD